MEPYKIKSLEPIRLTDRAYRKRVLERAYLNLFFVPSKDVMIDLLTDSGTGAMSALQWADLLKGDESYAGSDSFLEFERAVKGITGMPFVIPTHQGRSAERLILQSLKPKGGFIVSNMLFDTTRANAEDLGFRVRDLPCKEFFEDDESHPFKGNIDLNALEDFVSKNQVSGLVMTVTNNSAGGQPVSIENIKSAREICQTRSIPLILDGCRFAENAFFIQQRERGFRDKSLLKIAGEIFHLADMAFVSAKKDGLSHIGGFISLREEALQETLKGRLILSEGFPTYGGLAGRDLLVIARGLYEALEEPYLRHRVAQVEHLYKQLKKGGVPLLGPAGGHAVYIDAKRLLPHIPVSAYPGQAFVSALYEVAGVRSCEIGSVMFGKTLSNGKKTYHSRELVRLAIPRRLYTASHLDYVAEAILSWTKGVEAQKLKGVRFTKEPKFLRHFTAHFAYI